MSVPVVVRSASSVASGVVVLLALGLSATSSRVAEADDSHPLDPAIRLAKASRAATDKIADFQAIFTKQEMLNGRLGEPVTMHVKLRRKPFSVYLRFLRPHEGREVIYVEGRNDGNILAHEGGIAGIVGTIAVPVNSPRAMSENRYPITMMGMRSLVDEVIKQWEAETKYGEVDVKYYPDAKLQQMACRVVQTSHPRPRKEFKFHMTRLYVDKATGLPVRVEQYGFPRRPGEQPPLVEKYTYSQIKVNNAFDEIDFDPRNPKYGF